MIRETLEQAKLAVLGTVFLVLSISLILYGSTQPPNITILFEYTNSPEKVNLFLFIGVFLALFALVCWVFWFFRHFRERFSRWKDDF